MENKTFDLTEGGIWQKLLVIALPIMGSQLFTMLYNLTDMFFVGRISTDALAATGTAGRYIWLSVAFFLFGRMGAEIGVSQSLGTKKTQQAKTYAQNALFLALVLGMAVSTLMILFRHPLIGFLQVQEAHVADEAAAFLRIVALGFPFVFMSNALGGIFNGSGNSRIPFYTNVIGIVLNVILNPILIFVLGLGLEGAAIGTVISQGLSCLLLALALKRHPNRPFPNFEFRLLVKPEKEVLKQIFKWSLPISVESLLFTFLSMMISRIIGGFGADAITTNKVGEQIESLSWLIAGGFGSAVTAFVGQNFGASKWERIHRGFRISTVIMVIYGAIISGILFFLGGFLFSLFTPDEHIILLGVDYLRLFAIAQIFTCLESLSAGTFRGIGKTMPPSIVSISCNLIRVPLAYYFSQIYGLNGIWIGMVIGQVLRGAVLFIWYLAQFRQLKSQNLSKVNGLT